MLPLKNRLTKKKDFEVVFKEGKSVKNNFLIFKFLNNNLQESRFGFVVSKKVSNKAVVRNKVKRRLRSAVSTHLKSIKNSVDGVIIALPQSDKEDFAQVKQAVETVFQKVKLK